jgi:predicted nuclease of predicted toxin-antitoxin system
MRWLVDEGLPKALVDWLQQRGDEVLDVAASALRSKDDTVLWKTAGQEGRVVMSRDLGFMLPEVSPPPTGVVLVRAPNTFKANALLRLVQEGLNEVPETTLYGNVTIIEPGRLRQRRLADIAKQEPKR